MRTRTSLTVLTLGLCAFAQTPEFRDPKQPVAQRVADLLARMTLEEKLQEISGGQHTRLLDPAGVELSYPEDVFQDQSNPASTTGPRDWALRRNAVQRYQLQKTRLGIPWLFRGEALHGYMGYHATSFPQVPALASSWDPELVRQVFTAASDEMSAVGVKQAFTPVLDLARDPRWGRSEECYGEDPYLVSRMGVAAIRGLQGPDWSIGKHHVLATAKHFTAHGQPETGVNTGPANFSERILRENFLLPFQAAVQEAKVASVMASYNEIDGIPSHINSWLLQRVLREEWGFQGYVVSDGGGIHMLVEKHGVAASDADAARMALAAGIDYDLSDGVPFRTLLEQVQLGKVPVSQIDRAVSGELTAKFRAGLFDDPFVDPDYAEQTTHSPEHRALALKAAQKAVVLLKNEQLLLPLDPKKHKTIAVIGPNAADVHVGGYGRQPAHGVSLLQGIRERAAGAKVLYAEGCKITLGAQGWMGWMEEQTQLADPRTQEASIRQAVQVAKKADVAILVVGETESTNREAWSQTHLGDRHDLDLLGAQNELIRRVVETGVPTVVFLLNGRALSINYAATHAKAILEGWYLGQEGGTAAAQILFGDVNPGGKLPVSFPQSVGQLPIYYNHKPTTDRDYLDMTHDPLFPFGHGLSYTRFSFENLRLEPTKIGPGGSVAVHVEVTNTGSREGDEVPQLYIHQRVASVTRPVKELRGFRRISLKPGEKQTVTFTLTPEALSMLNAEMHRVVEPGIFDVMVGPSSAQTQSVPLEVVNP